MQKPPGTSRITCSDQLMDEWHSDAPIEVPNQAKSFTASKPNSGMPKFQIRCSGTTAEVGSGGGKGLRHNPNGGSHGQSLLDEICHDP